MRDRKYRDEIEEQLRLKHKITHVFQKRPYTMVILETTYDGLPYEEYAFTKVCWPDVWDKDRGIELCVNKILARLSKRIYDEMVERKEADPVLVEFG